MYKFHWRLSEVDKKVGKACWALGYFIGGCIFIIKACKVSNRALEQIHVSVSCSRALYRNPFYLSAEYMATMSSDCIFGRIIAEHTYKLFVITSLFQHQVRMIGYREKVCWLIHPHVTLCKQEYLPL